MMCGEVRVLVMRCGGEGVIHEVWRGKSGLNIHE